MRPELLLRLYPRAWRERYGEELSALIQTQSPLGLGAWLDLLRGALAAHLHPLAARPAIALRLTMWLPLVAASVAAAMVFINFSSGRPATDWRIWLPPSLLQDLIRSPFSNISPTLSEAEALEEPRVRFFMFRAEELNDFALLMARGWLRLALGAVLVLVGIGSLYAYRAQGPESPPFIGAVLALLPLVTLIALILVAASAFSRSAGRSVGPRRVEAVVKLAGLRDRGALTEDEFQREKQRLLA